ncbi:MULTISPECIES: hypothetical protein [Sorangium]|uniref:Uncharacterized protein n=1 Tax=Sorangium cellulosum TaxID=56 RepID=A0A4P2QSE6_SORCE|nr:MULTISPECIES: hypothetical protein [Sorangium]AUX33160.1 uncharacterized protein SOCE836_053140 [Sorangium cellulosum]AUX33217.1 uncharacterized protein SOCE836_053710 [Sorangium cellulosum]WCQ92536.1 hypothetical protein NQZ70_05277 [Sorangium sp. Soce836]
MSKPDMKGWTPEQIKAYEEAAAALAAEESAIAEASARQEREAASPEALAEKLREQAAAAREARARAARDAADDAAYRKACKEHGERRVARTRTVEGSVIQRAMTRQEHEEFSDRIAGLESEADILKVARAATLDTVVHPPRPRMLEILERYPRLWVHLYAARDELITGVEEAARGKG